MAGVLSGKVALVTGASSGIGEAIAITLGQAGAKVVLSARRAERLAAVAAHIEADGGSVCVIPGDVTDEAVAARTVAETVSRCGRLDILVNSAGIIQAGSARHADMDEWRHVMDVNFFGIVHSCKAALEPMLAQGCGDIVNISSTSGRRTAKLFGAYSPSKFAVNSYSEALRQEVGASGIRVCVVEPGATESECAENISDPEWREKMREHVSKPGALKAQDIADAVKMVLELPPRANVSEILVRPTIDAAAQF
ncbi:SDR family oxidoreductase [Novosphingobium album (ex Hu et al. 2023)]|uniref:SDR family NAD(P)-dependent oxidoreductase n=1 Tax=Novosphingobium album (ex Hu et al. 2023) TaxID=2930093 RepID=A0ABT0B626_9SPHN|nr:SDR family NAD(P)-dependent oxidoreductase [Novosphingobium album (ex Hu et al. 2023)]MCJ2180254.1 SDR family NAD(P)-dependent oxidoreductase [Novosphingobium album (ex Hu et al. 2023)]